MDTLTTITKHDRLHELEVVIEEGKDSWIAVGCAITEIKELGLYSEALGDDDKPYKTFEAYCQGRWGWTRQNANRIANASQIIKALPESTARMVTTVSSAAALLNVPVAARPAVVAAAAPKGGGPVTAKGIKAASSPPPRKTAPQAVEMTVDSTGLPIPPALLQLWERGVEAQELLTYISATRARLKKHQDSEDPLFAEVNFSSALSHLDQVYADIKVAKPYAVCPSCQGKATEGCSACKGRGLVSEFYFVNCVPEEVKAIRGK